MAYSALSDLLKEFNYEELAKLTGDSSGQQINEDRVNYAIKNADAIIDSYLYGRYTVPLNEPIDEIVRKISIDLAIFHLYEYSYRYGSVPASTAWRRINAFKMLKDIQKGDILLQNAETVYSLPPIISNTRFKERIFKTEFLKKFWGKE